MARPRKIIDMELVEKMAAIMCTQEEIAAVMDVSVDTLTRRKRFAEVYKRGQDKGRRSLRRMQWQRAESGHVTMLIWLGKQWLGQRDQYDVTGGVDTVLNLKFVPAVKEADRVEVVTPHQLEQGEAASLLEQG